MLYKYAKKSDYEYLSAGSVIKSYKGNTNFPVRLGNEIFHRCLKYIKKNDQISIYDPMCGSGYLLTTLGIQNFNIIDTIYGSDIDNNSLIVAEKNLRLLTKKGINERRLELQTNLHKYNRPSYEKSLDFIKEYDKIVCKDLNFQLFQLDIFKEDFQLDFYADVVIIDLPYRKLVNYKGNYTPNKLKNLITEFIKKEAVLAIIRNKTQRLKHESVSNRCEKLIVGKRIIEIFKKGSG